MVGLAPKHEQDASSLESADTSTGEQAAAADSMGAARPAAAPAHTEGVLLIGGDFQAVGVMRSLHDSGIPVYLLASEAGIAWYSRYAGRKSRNYDLLSTEDGASDLLELVERERLHGWVVYCVNDETVEFLAKNHERLSGSLVLPVPAWEVTRNFFEKDRAYRVASDYHIPVPRQYLAEDLEQLLAQPIDYPVVLKPTVKKDYYDKTKNKAVRVNDRDQLIREYRAMSRLIPCSRILVQEFLSGGTRSLYSFAALFDGQQVVSGLSAIRLRQHPMDFGHATTYAESRDLPELEALTTRFLQAVNYRGVAEVEFMYDEGTGQYKFIEMNGRFWGWHTLTQSAGLDFPTDLYRMLRGLELKPRQAAVGVQWTRLLTDAATVTREVLLGRMSVWPYLKNLFSKKGYAVWSWRDPLPFVVEVLMSPYLWWKKGF